MLINAERYWPLHFIGFEVFEQILSPPAHTERNTETAGALASHPSPVTTASAEHLNQPSPHSNLLYCPRLFTDPIVLCFVSFLYTFFNIFEWLFPASALSLPQGWKGVLSPFQLFQLIVNVVVKRLYTLSSGQEIPGFLVFCHAETSLPGIEDRYVAR